MYWCKLLNQNENEGYVTFQPRFSGTCKVELHWKNPKYIIQVFFASFPLFLNFTNLYFKPFLVINHQQKAHSDPKVAGSYEKIYENSAD